MQENLSHCSLPADKLGGNVTEIGTENVTENVTENRNKQIIELIKENNRVSTLELAKRLNVSRRTIARDIENLKHSNIIRRMGADKGGHWEIINDNM